MKHPYVILGGTGNVGSVLTKQLLKEQESVLIISHSAEKKEQWNDLGADFETADILDSKKLNEIFKRAERLFILNPPPDPSGDAEAQELEQIRSILKALEGLQPDKIVMASTYGARDKKGIFDLGTCYQLEQGLKSLEVPLAIIRSAYYMSNLDTPVEIAIKDGKLSTLFPPDFNLPMVAPQDIGRFAAELIQDQRTGTFYIQSRDEYSADDATRILSVILGKEIKPNEIPEKNWSDYMQNGGFSVESAKSFVGMTRLTLEEKFEAPDPKIGDITLEQYLREVVEITGKK